MSEIKTTAEQPDKKALDIQSDHAPDDKPADNGQEVPLGVVPDRTVEGDESGKPSVPVKRGRPKKREATAPLGIEPEFEDHGAPGEGEEIDNDSDFHSLNVDTGAEEVLQEVAPFDDLPEQPQDTRPTLEAMGDNELDGMVSEAIEAHDMQDERVRFDTSGRKWLFRPDQDNGHTVFHIGVSVPKYGIHRVLPNSLFGLDGSRDLIRETIVQLQGEL